MRSCKDVAMYKSGKGVSIVMPVFNGGKYIETAILSVLENGYDNFELIIVDSCSTDDTSKISILYAKKDSRIKYFNIKSSQIEAINYGVSVSTKEIVNWLNCDDVLFYGALARICEVFEKNIEVDFVYGNSLTFDDNGCILRSLISCKLDFEMYVYCSNIFQGALYFRKKVFYEFGGLDKSLKVSFEYKLFDEFFRNKNGYFINEYLAGFRIRSDQISSVHRADGLEEINSIRNREEYSLIRYINRVKKIFKILIASFSSMNFKWLIHNVFNTLRGKSIKSTFNINWKG